MIDTDAFESAQIVYNMLIPSVAEELPPHPAQDYRWLFDQRLPVSK